MFVFRGVSVVVFWLCLFPKYLFSMVFFGLLGCRSRDEMLLLVIHKGNERNWKDCHKWKSISKDHANRVVK